MQRLSRLAWACLAIGAALATPLTPSATYQDRFSMAGSGAAAAFGSCEPSSAVGQVCMAAHTGTLHPDGDVPGACATASVNGTVCGASRFASMLNVKTAASFICHMCCVNRVYVPLRSFRRRRNEDAEGALWPT